MANTGSKRDKAADQSPFFLIRVECPICKTINEFEVIKVGTYTDHGHDTDFCPTGREWRNPQYEAYNPLLFFMATCESCFYTREFKQSFKDWKNDNHFLTYHQKAIQVRHLQTLQEEDSVVKALGEARDQQSAPFATAVVKFLLGIYDELLFERPKKLDVGRFFLRIGWLYREHLGKPSPVITQTSFFARDIEKTIARLKHANENFDTSLESIINLVEERFAQLGEQQRTDEFVTLYNGLKESLVTIEKLQSEESGLLSSIAEQVQGNRQLLNGDSRTGSAGGVMFGGCDSFESFLVELKRKWEYVPLTEEEALVYAIEYYSAALEDGYEVQPGNQQIQATYLIAELSRRIARYEEARQYFNNAIRLGQQFIFDHRGDQTRTALAKKILELALEQGKANLAAIPEG
ncbi:MAG: DUF2225 domain-containing protein [candidate division Zixibacteria bacterium]|nr:DUF2225 domain-containing protein [candidate division Zixibacteria bacterium]